MIPLHQISGGFSLIELFDLPPIRVERSLNGKELPIVVMFYIAAATQRFLFGVSCPLPPWDDDTSSAGGFVEGLWHKDVVEAFIADRASSCYQEFNLSPRGAWWSCVFSAYRQRLPVQPAFPGVETFAERQPTNWRAAMSIPRSAIAVRFPLLEDQRLNICGVFGGMQRLHISIAELPLPADFHRVELFETIVRVTPGAKPGGASARRD